MAMLITEKLNKFLEEHPEDTKGDKQFNVCPLQGYDDLSRSSVELTKISNNEEVKKKKGLLTSLFKRRHKKESCMKKHGPRDSVQNFPSKVHPVLYSPAREDNKIDGRRKLDLKVLGVTGPFLGSSSISEVNRKRENWIKTDSEFLVLEL